MRPGSPSDSSVHPRHRSGTSVFLVHGAPDPVAPVANSRTLAQELTSQGYEVVYIEFQGDHTIPTSVALRQLDWFLDMGS